MATSLHSVVRKKRKEPEDLVSKILEEEKAKTGTVRKKRKPTTTEKEPELVIDRDKKPAWLPTGLKVVKLESLVLRGQELGIKLEQDKHGNSVVSMSASRNTTWLNPGDVTKLQKRLAELAKTMCCKISHIKGRQIVYVLGRGTFSDAELEDGAVEEILTHKGEYFATVDAAMDARDLLPKEPKRYIYKALVRKGQILKIQHALPEETPKPPKRKPVSKVTPVRSTKLIKAAPKNST